MTLNLDFSCQLYIKNYICWAWRKKQNPNAAMHLVSVSVEKPVQRRRCRNEVRLQDTGTKLVLHPITNRGTPLCWSVLSPFYTNPTDIPYACAYTQAARR